MKKYAWSLPVLLLGSCGSAHAPSLNSSVDAGVAAEGGVVAGSCTALPAPGTWDGASIAPVTFTSSNPSAFDGKSCGVVVDPFDPATVWLGTGYKGLFKSTDCGATFKHVNNGTNGSAIDQSVLWSIMVDPVNRGTMYTVGAYGPNGIWKSTNGGVDWVNLIPAGSAYATLLGDSFPGNISMDPANPKHLVVTSHGPCGNPDPLGCIAESTDGGATWPNIVQTPLGWAEDGGVQVLSATTWIWGTGDIQKGLYLTTDNGKHFNQVVQPQQGDVNGEHDITPLRKASDGAYYVSSLEGVVRSADGLTWSLAWKPKNGKSPLIKGIAVSPTTIYGSQGLQFYSAPISAPGNWSSLQGPAGLRQDAYAGFLAYNPTYHILYASLWAGGLYRYVTK